MNFFVIYYKLGDLVKYEEKLCCLKCLNFLDSLQAFFGHSKGSYDNTQCCGPVAISIKMKIVLNQSFFYRKINLALLVFFEICAESESAAGPHLATAPAEKTYATPAPHHCLQPNSNCWLRNGFYK
jgi:hypothetical protein